MPTFADSLRSLHDGTTTPDEIFAQIDREIAGRNTDPVTLLAVLYDEQASSPTESSGLDAVEKWILQRIHEANMARLGDTIVTDDTSAAIEAGSVAIDAGDTAPHAAAAAGAGLPPGVGSTLKKRFKLMERIGRGGMSSVFKAIDLRKIEARSGDPFIAVKILNPPFDDEAQALSLLQNEAAKLQMLAHPNIVRVIDCDRDGRCVFMTMEYLEGEPLERRLQRAGGTPLPAEDASRIIESIASALAVAHRNGIVHGDLKPANVIVTDRAEVKVIDFGIARLLSRETGGLKARPAVTARHDIMALTPAYASPEMLEKREPDPRDDIYALACIAHEILTGEHPYGRTDSLHARAAGLKLARRATLARRQYKAIAHGLAFERMARTPTATQFREELRSDSAGRVLRWGAYACLLLAVVAISFLVWLRRAQIEGTNARTAADLAAHTETIAPGAVFRDCPTCPLLKAVPAGTFVQGSLDDDPLAAAAEKPRHSVAIPAPFGIGAYEITVAEYREFVDATQRPAENCEVYDGAWQLRPDRSWSNPGFEQTASHPVVCVSWNDAQDYVSWLSSRTSFHYRLPSSSEWEYAARGGTGTGLPWDDAASPCEHANVADQTAAQQYSGWMTESCADGHVFTASVGSFAPNGFGLFDVIGNAFEWVQDCWHDDYRGAPADGAAWMAEPCSEREIRGGSWFTDPTLARSAYRNRFDAHHRTNSVGFRVVREIRP